MATKKTNPAAKRRIAQLAAIEQADAILKTAEDKQIERINEALVRSFAQLKKDLEKRWPKYQSGDTFATDRGLLLASELKAVLNVLDPKSKRTKQLKKDFKELLKLSDQNGNELAGQLLSTYTDSRGIAVDSTTSIRTDVLGEVTQEAYDRLLKYGTQFAQESSIIVQQGIIQGWTVSKTTKAMASRLGTTKARAEMIVRTETGKGSVRASEKRYAKEGVDLIQVIETQDTRVCQYCAARAGSIYKRGEYEVIKHPNCRGRILPIKEEWIEAGLVDLDWAAKHHADAVVKAGGENAGPAPFERSAGITPPKPWWKPGQKIKKQATKQVVDERQEALRRLANPFEWVGDRNDLEKLDELLSYKYFKQDGQVERIKGVSDAVLDSTFEDARFVGYDARDGKRAYKAEWHVSLYRGNIDPDADLEVPKTLTQDLTTLGATGAVQSVSVSIDGAFGDPKKKLSEKQRVRRAIASKRAWDAILETIPTGTLLHNDPVGGSGGKRARFYRKNGFGDKSATGQYGLVIEDGGKKKVVPVVLNRRPVDGKGGSDAVERARARRDAAPIRDWPEADLIDLSDANRLLEFTSSSGLTLEEIAQRIVGNNDE